MVTTEDYTKGGGIDLYSQTAMGMVVAVVVMTGGQI